MSLKLYPCFTALLEPVNPSGLDGIYGSLSLLCQVARAIEVLVAKEPCGLPRPLPL